MQNRTVTPAGTARRPWIARFTRPATMILFTGIAAAISYSDGLYLIRVAGAAGIIAYLYPLLPDGLILICSLSRRAGWSLGGVVMGVAVTLAMNIGAGILHNWLYAVADGFVSVAFFVALENIRHTPERGRGDTATPLAPAAPETAGDPPAPGEPQSPELILLSLVRSGKRREIAALLGVPPARVQKWATELPKTVRAVPEDAPPETPEPVPEQPPIRYAELAGASQGHAPAALNGSAHGG